MFFFKISNGWKYSFSLRFPLFPWTPNLFHFKYVKVKNCTEIITMFFSRSSYTRALKFRYKLDIKRTNANKALRLTSFDAKGRVRMTLQSERCKSNLHCLPILYSGDKNFSLMYDFPQPTVVCLYAIASYRKNRTGFALLLYIESREGYLSKLTVNSLKESRFKFFENF